jgi:hypothetical protein
MPFKSQAQRRKFAQLMLQGKISPQTFEEWNRETGGAKLPERVRGKAAKKSAGKRSPAKKSGRKGAKKTSARKTTARKKTSARKTARKRASKKKS